MWPKFMILSNLNWIWLPYSFMFFNLWKIIWSGWNNYKGQFTKFKGLLLNLTASQTAYKLVYAICIHINVSGPTGPKISQVQIKPWRRMTKENAWQTYFTISLKLIEYRMCPPVPVMCEMRLFGEPFSR